MKDLKSSELLLEKFAPSLSKNDKEVFTRTEALVLIRKVCEETRNDTLEICEDYMDDRLACINTMYTIDEHFSNLKLEQALIIR